MTEILLGQKCRMAGRPPAQSAADYHYTVVAAWLEENTVGRQVMMCAVVADSTGKTNVMPFLDLEFSDLSWD